MYCRNCGVEVPNNEELCEACRMEQIISETNAPRVDMSHECRGAAITSAVLSIVGLVMVGIMAGLRAFGSVLVGALFSMTTLGCLIICLILGIRGISAFRRAASVDAARPVASLVCGIIGVVTTGFGMLYYLIAIFAVF